MLSSLAPARRRLVFAAGTILVAGAVAGVVVAVTDSDSPARPTAQGTPGPVVLVPGYGGSTTGLDQLATMLRAHGKTTTVVTLPGDGRGDLDAQASALGDTVSEVRRETGVRDVDVVGYSAGGVVARLWVRSHGGASQARRVVTLGSPHHGTDVAALADSVLPGACPTACQQLTRDSALLTRLNAGDETPVGPTWVSIWTTHDDVVVPPASAALAGALDFSVQSICPRSDVSHGALPADPSVAAMVLAELAAGPPERPQTCATLSS